MPSTNHKQDTTYNLFWETLTIDFQKGLDFIPPNLQLVPKGLVVQNPENNIFLGEENGTASNPSKEHEVLFPK